jgi:hypothetical protein
MMLLEQYYARFYCSKPLSLPNLENKHSSQIAYMNWERAVIKKTCRWYDFINSDADFAIFLDIDCLPIDININVLDCVNTDHVALCFGPPSWYENKYLVKMSDARLAPHRGLYSSDFAAINRNNAAHVWSVLEQMDMNPFEESGYKRWVLRAINSRPCPNFPPHAIGLPTDECILNFAFNNMPNRSRIHNAHDNVVYDVSLRPPEYQNIESIKESSKVFCHFGGRYKFLIQDF